MGYEHLNIDEREVILKMQAQKASMREIGRSLGRSGGTISRELNRNISSICDYKPHLAQRYYRKRRSASLAATSRSQRLRKLSGSGKDMLWIRFSILPKAGSARIC